MVKFLVTFLVFIIGCSSTPFDYTRVEIQQKTFPQIISWNKGVDDAAASWLHEAYKRFEHPVIFICHGNSKLLVGKEKAEFQWYLYPDEPLKEVPVQDVANTLSNMYPDREIILVVCNPYGDSIDAPPNVYYAKKSVWTWPDDSVRGIPFTHETEKNKDYVGSIWEFSNSTGK